MQNVIMKNLYRIQPNKASKPTRGQTAVRFKTLVRLTAHCATYVFLEKVDGGKSGTLGFI